MYSPIPTVSGLRAEEFCSSYVPSTLVTESKLPGNTAPSVGVASNPRQISPLPAHQHLSNQRRGTSCHADRTVRQRYSVIVRRYSQTTPPESGSTSSPSGSSRSVMAVFSPRSLALTGHGSVGQRIVIYVEPVVCPAHTCPPLASQLLQRGSFGFVLRLISITQTASHRNAHPTTHG